MDIWHTLNRAVRLYPEQIGVVDGARRLTWADVGDRTDALARYLGEQGIRAGDRVAILEDNTHPYLETYYAAAGLGAILNPLNVRLSPGELGFILRDGGARLLVTGTRFADLVAAVLAERTPVERILWIGGVPGSANHAPGHDYEEALAAIQTEGVTLTNLVPTMLNLMVNHPRVADFDTTSLRLILSGGAPIAPELVRRINAAFGCDYVQTYGMTETSPYLTVSVLKEHLRSLPPNEQLGYRATEVENSLYEHPAILEAAVFAVPDQHWGEAVRAAVVLRAGESATEEDIIGFCKGRLAAYKAPKAVDFLDGLPRTGSGKIAKRALRDAFAADAPEDG